MPNRGSICRLFVRSLAGLSTIVAVSADCYYPNGTDRNQGLPEDRYLPINTGDDFSMCCTILGDKPRSDGLCENAAGTVIWRESCTDRTWQSPKCIKLCASSSLDTNGSPGIGGRQADNDEPVTPCVDGSYCCGDGSLGSECCNNGRGVFLRDGTTQKDNPASTSSGRPSSSPISTTLPTRAATSAATTAGLVASSTPTVSSASLTAPESKPSVGAIVGGVIGGLAGLVLVLAALWFLIFRKRKSIAVDPHKAHQQSHPPIESPCVQEAQGSYMEDYKRSELEAGYVDKAAGRPEMEAYDQPDSRIPAGKAELV
ncbi:MAG: hypothetical protein Q9172_003099 [Xanthocarpia lactea]